jgi:hypothetical protein
MTGAQFEIRIDGTPRTYRDRKDFAMEAARLIKSKNPHSIAGLRATVPRFGGVLFLAVHTRSAARIHLTHAEPRHGGGTGGRGS